MADSQTTRHQNAASITDKEVAKADMDTAVEETKAKLDSQQTSLQNLHQYILQLHANCDFLVENYDLRKAARENELTSLANAKATLSGASLSRIVSLFGCFDTSYFLLSSFRENYTA